MANPDYTAQDVPTWAANLDSMNSLKAIGNIKNPLLELPFLNSLAFARGLGSLTFARADSSPGGTLATYVDLSDGLVKTVVIDLPRFEANGLLIEKASTNKILWADEFTNVVWADVGADSWSAVANNQTAPDGVINSADTITLAGTSHGFRQILTLATGSSFSLWLKVLTGAVTGVNVDHGDGTTDTAISFGAGDWIRLKFPNLIKGANDWIDMTITTTAPGATISLWRGQFEELPFVTSGIPTTAVAVTRSAETCTVTALGNIPKASEPQTWLIDWSMLGIGKAHALMNMAGESFRRIETESNGVVKCFYGDSNGQVFGPVLTPGVTYRLGMVHDGGGAGSFWIDGVKIGTFSGADVTDALGSSIQFGLTGYQHVSNARIYNRALSDREMAVA